MAVQQYYVEITFPNGTSPTVLSNVQNVNYSTGRERQLDQYAAARGVVTVRQPAAPSSMIVPGNVLKVFWDNPSGSDVQQVAGIISDVSITYGIPYAGGQGPGDYLTISFEGYFANLGRADGANYAMAAGDISTQAGLATAASGSQVAWSSGGLFPVPQMAATTVASTWGDWVNAALLTVNGRMRDGFNAVFMFSPYYKQAATVNFSDTTNNATNQVYDQITFDSMSDNYYTQVTVDPESFVEQTASSGSVPYRTYTVNTLNASTGQALDYANYLLGNYSTRDLEISSISCLANAQNAFRLYDLTNTTAGTLSPGNCTAAQISVAFRGTTYQCVIEGVSFSATPGEARYTYYVSGADLNAYLILDDATFGRLDFNKLGY